MASTADEFAGVSTDVLSILDAQLAMFSGAAPEHESADPDAAASSTAAPARDRVLFYKMKADTHRYLAEQSSFSRKVHG